MRAAFVCLPNILTTSLTNAMELFFAANQVAKTLHRKNHQGLELVTVAKSLEQLKFNSGLTINPQKSFDDDCYDLIYIPALWRSPNSALQQTPELTQWLKRQFEAGAILNGTGTGVCFLAESGLLNGRPATTHWHYFDEFADRYPLVHLKRQHFITSAGRIYCAASINAQTDLTLHHVHRLYGKQVADHLSKHFSHEVRQDFDRLSFKQDQNTNHPDEQILQTQLWMQANYSDPELNVYQVARKFGMSPRNFSRRFLKASDTSPRKYLQNLRYQHARELIRSTNLSVGEVLEFRLL